MEIRFYTPELNLIGIMENQTSLLWTRKFYEPGSFQLITPITDYNVRLCQLGNIISIDGADEAAVIECVTIRQEHSRRIITAVGRMLSSYFDRRLIRPAKGDRKDTYNFRGTVEDGMRELVSRLEYPIPKVVLGAHNGFEEEVTYQATYKNMLVYLEKLSMYSKIGFRLVPDFTAKTLTFETYKGLDHSIHQSERTRVEFSEDFQNISTVKYQEDSRNYKNIYYMKDSNSNYWQLGDDEYEGVERREVLDSSGFTNEDFMMYVYQEPVFNEVLPTEKLTNIAVYEDDPSQPVWMHSFYLTDKNGNEVVVTERLSSAASMDPITGRYGANYFTVDWTSKTGMSNTMFIAEKGRRAAGEVFGLERSSYSGNFQYIATKPYDKETGLTYVRSTSTIGGYRKRFVGYREETDAEFQRRVDAYYDGLERWHQAVLDYQEQYAKDLAAYKKREDSFYKKYRMIVNFEPVINPYGNFEYRNHWDLGDTVTVEKEGWGVSYDLQVTEVQEIYEHGLMMIAPTLGNVLPESIDWEDK